MITLSAPELSGYSQDFETIADVYEALVSRCGIAADDLVEVVSPDGGTVYCYDSQEAAAADETGAYAVQYTDAA